ncbi:MAG: TonB-dependent receptor, partial [Spirochaetales bacterium]|nr:TonB-dependent receptor [Spirochaetales bacterium]
VRLIILVFVLFFPLILPAGVYGTLAGMVADASTGEALTGVNIIIEDTRLGTTTDTDGFFILSTIPPGTYAVTAHMMGYQQQSRANVHVLADLRTRLDFVLTPVTLDLGEKIEVVAAAPMMQRDVTATTHFLSRDEIEALPLKNFNDAVQIQPGVAAGHFRGGRLTEVLYLVDGLPIRGAIEGEIGSDLPNSAVVDMSIQTGGFNAEYGNAMSGVVNIITREGSNEFFFRSEVAALDLSDEYQPFPRSARQDWEIDVSAGGGILPDKLSYYASVNMYRPNSRWVEEELGLRRLTFADDESYNGNLLAKITYKLRSATKLTAQGMVSLWSWTEYDHQWRYNLAGLPRQDKKSYRVNLSFTHAFSDKSYLDFYLSQYNVLKSVQGKSSRDQKPLHYQLDPLTNLEDPLSYVTGGDYPWWMDHEEIHNTLKCDYVNQWQFRNQLKTGGEATFYRLYKFNDLRRELYSFDPKFPRYISYVTEYDYRPRQASWYIQNKMDYDGFIANLGIRIDVFDPRAARPMLEVNVTQTDSAWIVNQDKMVRAEMKTQLSPRLGISLPISENSDVRFNYGYFFQMPAFDYLYTNLNLNTAAGFSPLGNPDLKPAKTIAYEMGYRISLRNMYLLDVTIFNKDVSNLIDSNTYMDVNQEVDSYGFARFVNASSVSVRGFECYIKKRYGNYFGGSFGYTYMVAKGTGSSEFERLDWLDQQLYVPVDEYPLSWDQTHTLVVNLDVNRPGSWGVNTLVKWNSGLPYTRSTGYSTRPNANRIGNTFYLDIRMVRIFRFREWTFKLYSEIYNLFDYENILWVDNRGIAGGRLGDISARDQGRRIKLGMEFRL